MAWLRNSAAASTLQASLDAAFNQKRRHAHKRCHAGAVAIHSLCITLDSEMVSVVTSQVLNIVGVVQPVRRQISGRADVRGMTFDGHPSPSCLLRGSGHRKSGTMLEGMTDYV